MSKKANKALLRAAEDGDVEALKAALAAGADVNTVDDDGYTALYHAADQGHEEVVAALLEVPGIDVNRSECGFFPLHTAAFGGHVEVVKKLLSAPGIDVNIKNELYDTPLDNASEAGHEEIVELLIAAGAEGVIENQQDNEGEVDDLIWFEEEDGEERDISASDWKGNIRKMQIVEMYWPGVLPMLLNVGENDRLMFVRCLAQETSNKCSDCEREYIAIWLKRAEDGEWRCICCPKDDGNVDPHFPQNWSWDEILDFVWDEKIVTYTTKMNEDCEQIEATWEVEE